MNPVAKRSGGLHAGRQSWIDEANAADCGFPLENLPFCMFRHDADSAPTVGVGIGERVVDLFKAERLGLLRGDGRLERCAAAGSLNALFEDGSAAAGMLRGALLELLAIGAAGRAATESCLYRLRDVVLDMPFSIGDYTDFLASYNHAFNVGMLYRPGNPVLPNFKSMPIAYHGRASSVVVSGEPVYRPRGLFRSSHDSDGAVFGLTRRLDFEMELGVFIGMGNSRGRAVAVDEADDRIAGVCLLNDWSARDIQAWETQPLGPFLGKNFCTTISAWVVTPDALAPYRVPLGRSTDTEADYLRSSGRGGETFEICAEVSLLTSGMADAGLAPQVVSRSVFSRDSYWTFAQMIAHHTVNGCNLRTGDLLGTGTLSGPAEGTQGCLLELTHGGARPIVLANGEQRVFLEDGDEVRLAAYCRRGDGLRIGFGECAGRVGPMPS